jgi:hypothetical protein
MEQAIDRRTMKAFYKISSMVPKDHTKIQGTEREMEYL